MKHPVLVNGLPVVVGIFAFAAYIAYGPDFEESVSVMLPPIFLIFAISGAVSGLMVFRYGLRAGLLTAAPFVFAGLFAFMFAGIITPRIISHDFPIVLTVLAASVVGAFLSSRLVMAIAGRKPLS